MKRLVSAALFAALIGSGSLVLAAESPISQWKTIDDKTRSCPTWSSTDPTEAVAIVLVTGGTFR
jgi:hypothetical protein